jgi:hypothetical protein
LIGQWFRANLPEVDDYLYAEKTDKKYYRVFNTRERRRKGRSTQPYAVIANRLQQLESKIVIDHCCVQLLKQNPRLIISTIHDGILVPADMQQLVVDQLRTSFAEHGLSPRISTEQKKQQETNTGSDYRDKTTDFTKRERRHL